MLRTSIWFLLLLFFSIDAPEVYEYVFEIKDSESTQIGLEDLQGRLEYEQMLLRNPYTKKIPEGINTAELHFIDQQIRSSPSLRSTQLSATSLGPVNVGGRTRAVAFDIRNENIIIAGGVSGGIWKSVDGGKTWSKKTVPENRLNVTALAQDTRLGNEDTWYYGTGEIIGNSARGGGAPFRGDGMFKSTDNGETWEPLPSTQSNPTIFNSQFQYIWNIVTNPFNEDEDEVLVAAFGGILRSVDGGASWEVVLGQKLFDLDNEIDLNESNASTYVSLEQASNGLFYAALSTVSQSNEDSPQAGIYFSTDGEDWQKLDVFSAGSKYRRIVIGNNPSEPLRPYFLVDSTPILIFQLNLAQGTLQDLSENVPDFGGDLGGFETQGSYNMMLKVHPENPSIVFAGGTNLYRTTDGFRSSENNSWVGGYDPGGGADVYINHHPDQHNLLFYPSDPNKILSANDGGLMLSRDGTADSVQWESLNNGYVTSQFYTIAQSRVPGSNLVLGGMQDNGTDIRSDNSSSNWKGIIGGDGGYVATTDDSFLWFASFQNGQSFRLTFDESFNISSFARIDPEELVTESGSAFLFINPFILDPTNENRVFFAGGNSVYLNENISQIPSGSQEPTTLGWKAVDGTLLQPGSYAALDASLDGKTVYAGSNNGVLKRIDHADSVVPIGMDITASIFPDGYISSIAVDPDNGDHILVIFSNYGIPSIFESFDGGDTFENISGNLEENPDGSGDGPSIRWAEIVPTTSGKLLLVGTSVGLFTTFNSDGSSTVWQKESIDVIGSSIITMMDYRPADGSLVIATHGNGVFKAQIQDFRPVEHRKDPEDSFYIINAFPNPFNTVSAIQYNLPTDATVKADLFDSSGKLVKNLLFAPQSSGRNTISIDGNNINGTSLHNGVYYVRITYEDSIATARIVLRR